MKDVQFSFRQATPNLGSQELTEEYIRTRAYQIYEEHGRLQGHDKEDWYEAEAEILGKEPAPVRALTQREHRVSHAAAA